MNIQKSLIVLITISYLLYGCKNENNYEHKADKLNWDNAKILNAVEELVINKNSDTLLFSVQDIIISNPKYIYVSDLADVSIKKFSREGNLIKQIGGRGEAPGKFKVGPSKLAYNSLKKLIAVVDHTTPFINLYDEDLNFTDRIIAPFSVTDIDYDDSGKLLVAMPPIKGWPTSILILDQNSETDTTFNPKNLYGHQLLDMFSIRYNPFSKNINILFFYRNLIQSYDYDGVLVREFAINGFPYVSDRYPDKTKAGEVPKWKIFRDFFIDKNGFMYILTGGNLESSGKKIFILDQNYIIIKILILPIETNIILSMGNDHYYCSGNYKTSLIKYGVSSNDKK